MTRLLDNRSVTTHWRIAQDVFQRFPKLHVNYTASFLRHGPFDTCGGGSANRDDIGSNRGRLRRQLALSVARELVMDLHHLETMIPS